MDSILPNIIHLDATEKFLAELSDLSRKYGIAINERGVIFVMEPIDIQFSYILGQEGNITLS